MKIRSRNLLTAILTLLCAVTVFCSIGMLGGNNNFAIAKTPTDSDIVIGEIAPNAGDPSASKNLKMLYSALIGEDGTSIKTLDDVRTYFNVNAHTVKGTGCDVKGLNADDYSKTIYVTLGGIQWNVVYLTLNNDGELILDLWQSEPTIPESPMADGQSTADRTLNNPSCIYGTSYMSCQVLGNGGDYYNYDNPSSPVLKTADPTTSAYYEFAQGKYAEFFEAPANMKYQETQNAPDTGLHTANFPNDAWGVPSNETGWAGINYGPTGMNKTGYSDWKNDKIWLPSFSEIFKGKAIWGSSALMSTENIPSNGLWLRSGMHSYGGGTDAVMYGCLNGTGGIYGVGCDYSGVAHTVRPAVHLNFKKLGFVAQDVEVTYNGTAQTMADVAAADKSWYDSDKMTLDYIDAPMITVGEYKVKATLTQSVIADGLEFVGEPDTSAGESATVRYFKFKITPKPLDATLTETDGTVTLTVDESGLCGADALPNTAIQYTSTDGRGYNSTLAPQQKGDFKAEPKITDTDSNYKLNCTPASVTYTISAIKVSLPTLPPTATPEYDGTVQTVALSGYTHNGKGVNILSVTGKTASNKNVATAPTFDATNGEVTFKDAGTYTVTLTLEDAANCVWQDGGTGRKEITFTVNPKQLTVAAGNDNGDLWSWGVGTAVKATVTVSGIVSGDSVTLITYYETSAGAQVKSEGTVNGGNDSVSDVLDLPANLLQGDYTLSAETDNENYSLADGLAGAGMPLTFTIGSVVFDPDAFTWVYSENNATGNQQIQDGDSFLKYKLDSAGNPFTYTLSINLGNFAGIFGTLTDTDYTNRKQSNAGTYKTTVRLKIKNTDYSFDTTKTYNNATIISTTEADVFINWTVEKGDFTGLENLTWVYRYGTGDWADYNPSRPPEFGNGTVTVKMKDDVEGTLKGLTFNYGGINSERNKGKYVVKMSFGVTDMQNFNIPQGFNFEWEITKKIINVQWEQDVAITYDGTKYPELQGNEYYATQLRYEKPEFADKVEYIYSCTLPDGSPYSGRGTDALAYITEQALAAQRRIEVEVTVELKNDASILNDYELTDSTGGDFSTSFMVGDNKLPAKVELTASGEYGDFDFNVTVTGEDMDSGKYTVAVYKGTNISDPNDPSNTLITDFDPKTADAGKYFIVVTLTGNWENEYRLSGKVKAFEILPKGIDLPVLNDVIFTGGEINVVDYLTGFDENLMEFADGEYAGLRNVSKTGYTFKLRITNPNYCWNYGGDVKAAARYSVSDYEINKIDSTTAVYNWNISPLIVDTTNLWNKGAGGATLNLPQNVKDLIAGGTLELGYRYYDGSGQLLETPELKGGRSFKVEAVFGGDDAERNVQFRTGEATYGAVSKSIDYTVPQSGAAAFMNTVKDFMTGTWLGLPVWSWFLIGLALLILLIIIIVVAAKRRKSKEEREAKKAAKEEEKARREEERRLQQERLEEERRLQREKLEAEREIAKAKQEAELEKIRAQAQLSGAAGIASVAAAVPQAVQQPQPQVQVTDNSNNELLREMREQMAELRADNKATQAQLLALQNKQQVQQPQVLQQPMYPQMPMQMPMQSYGGDAGTLARLEAQINAMQAEQRARYDAEQRIELAAFRAESHVDRDSRHSVDLAAMREHFNGGIGNYPQQQQGNPIDALGAIVAAALKTIGSSNAVPPVVQPAVAELPQQTGQSATVTAKYPPDAVVTTTTTVDTTKNNATLRRDENFDIDGFYDPLD